MSPKRRSPSVVAQSHGLSSGTPLYCPATIRQAVAFVVDTEQSCGKVVYQCRATGDAKFQKAASCEKAGAAKPK